MLRIAKFGEKSNKKFFSTIKIQRPRGLKLKAKRPFSKVKIVFYGPY